MANGLAKQVLNTLGRRICDLRRAQGFSQEAFADRCNLHRTFIGTVERGESNLSFSNLFRVASALGISLATLLEGVDQNLEHRGRESAKKTGNPSLRPIRRSAQKKS